MVAVLKIDFTWVLITVICERVFNTYTTYPFDCLIFQLCKEIRVPIYHCDTLCSPTLTVNIGLIKDEANVAAQ